MSRSFSQRIVLFHVLGVAALVWPNWLPAAEAGAKPVRPNIVFVLADDLGFETLGAYGGVSYEGNANHRPFGPVQTPNIDTLAKNGMRFGHCFCEPVCSPSRAEFLTGKYNFRSGFVSIAGRFGAPSNLDEKAHPTLAANLKAAGYVTAITGKWHLGKWSMDREVQEKTQGIPPTPDDDTDCPHVKACGFDRQFVFSGSRLEEYGPPTPAGYVPARFHNWALRFLDNRKGKSEPFFLYYASPIPHVPLRPTPLNPDEKEDGNINFPSAVRYLDWQVGDLARKLEEIGARENTLLIFSGDNGTCNVATKMRDGAVVAGGKATMLDTGSWVPLIVSWPAKIPAGSIYDGLVQFPDLMPTFLDLAGAKLPAGLDGISFAAQLQGNPGAPREWVHVLHASEVEKKAEKKTGKPNVKIFYFVRDAKWKLRENGELYDVSRSPYAEKLVKLEDDTSESKAARERLGAVLRKLHD